jgi:hypothetical protein
MDNDGDCGQLTVHVTWLIFYETGYSRQATYHMCGISGQGFTHHFPRPTTPSRCVHIENVTHTGHIII